MVMDHALLIVDSRNVTRGLIKTKARVVSLASSSASPADASELYQPV
jgi:hypothetical protein